MPILKAAWHFQRDVIDGTERGFCFALTNEIVAVMIWKWSFAFKRVDPLDVGP